MLPNPTGARSAQKPRQNAHHTIIINHIEDNNAPISKHWDKATLLPPSPENTKKKRSTSTVSMIGPCKHSSVQCHRNSGSCRSRNHPSSQTEYSALIFNDASKKLYGWIPSSMTRPARLSSIGGGDVGVKGSEIGLLPSVLLADRDARSWSEGL